MSLSKTNILHTLCGCLIIAATLAIVVFVNHTIVIDTFNNMFDQETELVLVVSHFNEDIDWLLNAPYPVVVCEKEGSQTNPRIGRDPLCFQGVNRGREASSYIKFILVYYEYLPKYVAFIHGHETAWHQKFPGGIFQAIARANYKEHKYVSLNNKLHTMVLTKDTLVPNNVGINGVLSEYENIGHLVLQLVWDKYFKPYIKKEFPHFLRYDCCAQFIVSRELIKQYPKYVYEHWYKLLMEDSYKYLLNDYQISIAFEYIWHIIFSKPIDICTDKAMIHQCDDIGYRRSYFR